MHRDQALALIDKHLEAEHMRKHCLASEAIMRALAEKLGHDADNWGLAGLLHDLDHYQTKEMPERHGLQTARILEGAGVSPEVIRAIGLHNDEASGNSRETALDYALTAADMMSGMVVATALFLPDKTINAVEPAFVVKRIKEEGFARAIDREKIGLCRKLDLSLEEFAVLSLEAMGRIAGNLGL